MTRHDRIIQDNPPRTGRIAAVDVSPGYALIEWHTYRFTRVRMDRIVKLNDNWELIK